MASTDPAVSSQTRKKLKGFEYKTSTATKSFENGMHSGKSGKENNDGTSEDNKNRQHVKPNAQQEDSTTDDLPRNCPQTPVHRIPLADLIGNTEEALNRPAQDVTPDDHVYWQAGPRSSDPANSSQPRGKKRARSSSPALSQLEKSTNFPLEEAPSSFNFGGMQQLLKTPQTDPALDLWNRYADIRGVQRGEGRQFGAFANIVSSSPQTPGTTSSKKGLRKAMSCGIEWPMSKAKRMRLDGTEALQHAEDVLAQPRETILSSKAVGSSRVNLLMEKIQESLKKGPQVREQHPSSSSPLPSRFNKLEDFSLPTSVAAEHRKDILPEQERSRTKMGESLTALPKEATNRHAAAVNTLSDGSSDYGDDLFDDEFLAVPMAVEPTEASDLQQSFDKSSGSDDDNFGADDFEELVAQMDEDGLGLTETIVDQNSQKSPGPVPKTGIEEDEFGGDDGLEELWDQVSGSMATAQDTQSKALNAPRTNDPNTTRQSIKRYLIIDVADSEYSDEKGRHRHEKVLSVKDEKTREMKAILLRQCWLDTRAAKGTYVHLIGEFDRGGHCVVDDANNLIVTHPDILISATGVSDSFQCLRRSVLADRVKATSEPNPAQVYGSLLHEIFQEALKENRWDMTWLELLIGRTVAEYLESLYQINITAIDASEYLKSKMPELRAWAALFISARPQAAAFAQERNGLQVNVGINKLLEVEEHVWSPMYGLKGNIDATVQAVVKETPTDPGRTFTIPLELKTGKRDTSEAHRAQTALYTLLLHDRYDVTVMFGLLYYIETSKVFSIPAVRNEIRHMIVQRNELASFVHSKLDLPAMAQKPHMCNSCYAKTSCWTYHRLKEDGNGQTSGLGEKFDQAMNHLTPADQEWFRKWDDLITKEEKDMMKFRRELWTMKSSERQKLGRCFGAVIVDPGSAQETKNRAKIDRYRYTFVKQHAEPGFSFTESQLTVGEPIVISDEEGHFALAMGYITNVRPNRLSVAVDRRLHNVRTKGHGFDAVSNQTFRGIMNVQHPGVESSQHDSETETPVVYRIDKDEFNSGLATIRNNLIRILEKDLYRARELRQLIINGAAPSFKPASSAYTLTETASQQLNVDQRKAIEKVMSAQDYALVLGMPGTGKTTTIAHLIRALVMQGKTVLLNSYTHTAVDNILLKIKNDKIKVLRIGSLGKIHSEVQAFADLAAVPKKTVAELEDSYVNSQVVATTCLGVNHPIFNQRVFDYCIVDEASQITLPTCLSGLRMARRFVLVGDHYQLPPLVQNKEAQEGGLDISLFKTLSDLHPDSVVSLEHQYRMNADIMLLSNTLIYSGRLKCGTARVAQRTLSIPDLDTGLASHHERMAHEMPPTSRAFCTDDRTCWLRAALAPEATVSFLNTDLMGSSAVEVTQGPRTTNTCEAILCSQLVSSLVSSGIGPREIGVITFYRSQLALLRQQLGPRYSEVEMHTADKFQGRDKEIIILSCVRSNDSGSIGDLLKDWRRVNVALTRARSKLLIIGSRNTLAKSQNEVLERFVQLIDSKGWVVNLSADAIEGHVFEMSTQFTSAGSHASPEPKSQRFMTPKQKRGPKTSPTPSPLKQVRNNGQNKHHAMRQPDKVGKGLGLERILKSRPIMNDIMNDIG